MAGEMAAQSKRQTSISARSHRRVEVGDVELGCEQITVDIGKSGKVFIKLGLTLVHGRIQHLEQPRKPTAKVGTVLAGPGLKQVKKNVSRLEDAGVIGEQAEHRAHQEQLQVMAAVTGHLERIMQPSHRCRGFDVDRILITEGSALHAQDEAELLDMVVQVRQRESNVFTFVQIVKLEGLEITNQDIARAGPLGQAVEILPGLSIGAARSRPALFCSTIRTPGQNRSMNPDWLSSLRTCSS